MPSSFQRTILAALLAGLGMPVIAETTTLPMVKVSPPVLRLGGAGVPQTDCSTTECITSFVWDPPPAGEPSQYLEVYYELCSTPDETKPWTCEFASWPKEDYWTFALATTHKHRYNYTTPSASPPPATATISYKLVKTYYGDGRTFDSNIIRVPMIQPLYFKRDGQYFEFGKNLDNYNPGISVGYLQDGSKQEIFEIIDPSADIGTRAVVTATQPASGSVSVDGKLVSVTPSANANPFERNILRVKVTKDPSQLATVTGPVGESVVRLNPTAPTAADPVSFVAVPATQTGSNFSLSGLKYSYIPSGDEANRTIFSYPASYTNQTEYAFSIIQDSGTFCPIFSAERDLRDYLKSSFGPARVCLVEKDATSTGQQTSISWYTPGVQIDRFYTSDGNAVDYRLNNIVKAVIGVPKGTQEETATLNTTVKVMDRDLNVFQTVQVPYSVKVVQPSEYHAEASNLVPSFLANGVNLLLVTNKASPAFDYVVTGGDPAYLKVEGSPLLPAASRRFEIETARMTATDSRLGSVDNRTEVYRYLLNVVKETIPVSASNRNADGTIRVLVNASRAATGHYLLTLKRQAAGSGAVTVAPENQLIKVGPAPSSTPIAFDPSNPRKNRTLDRDYRVAELMIPKNVVDDVLATGDRLFFEASAASDVLSEADVLRGEAAHPGLFIETLEINGLTGYVSASPTGEFNLTNVHSIFNKTSSAYLINLKSAAKTVWSISKDGGPEYTVTKEPAGDLDLTQFEPGTYQITPKLYAINNSLSKTLPTLAFTQYAAPTATFSYPTTMVIGSNNNLTALVTNVPPNAVATWRIGSRTVPGVIAPDGKTITGVYVPVASSLPETLTLEIQINPETFDAIAVLNGPSKVTAVEALNPDISTTYKVFWSKKGGTFDYKGTKDTTKLDWIVSDLLGNVVKTKSVVGRAAFTTTGLLPGDYRIKARAYDKFGAVADTNELSFRVLLEPTATFKMGLSVVAGNTMPLVSTVSNIAEGALLTWNIGESSIPGTLNEAKNQVTGTFPVPLVPANYRSSLAIQVDPSNAYAVKTFDIGTIKATGYAKLTALVEAPKFLDVGLPTSYKATIKAPWDTKVLPLNENTLHTEWEMPDGTRLAGTTLSFTPTIQDYPLYLAGKRPIFRAWMDADKNGTLIEVATTATLYEPWVFPTFSLVEKAGSSAIIAPGAVLISAMPREAVLPAMATYRGLTYEWSFPDSPGFIAAAKRENLSMTINEPGTYPITVKVSDRYGAEQVLNYQVVATKAEFSITKIKIIANPERMRAPTQIAIRADVGSTHKKERLKNYQTFADGILIGAGTNPKPFVLSEPGDHEVTLIATSSLGNVAKRTEIVTIVPNVPPICQPFKIVYGTSLKKVSVKANAMCADSDGRIKKYEWTVNGVPTKVSSGTQFYVFDTPDPVTLEVKVTDDSGASTTHSETIPMQ
jgi:hypothetical protein